MTNIDKYSKAYTLLIMLIKSECYIKELRILISIKMQNKSILKFVSYWIMLKNHSVSKNNKNNKKRKIQTLIPWSNFLFKILTGPYYWIINIWIMRGLMNLDYGFLNSRKLMII
jgi:hypothetical protein